MGKNNKYRLFEVMGRVDSSFKSKMNEDFSTQEQGNPTTSSIIDGVSSKRTAMDRIYRAITPITQGIFTDEDWRHVRAVWEKFNELGLDWDITENSEYDREMPPKWKKWYFEINFVDGKGRPQKLGGNLTAAGAGSVEDPLERYDISVVLY